MTQPGEEIFLPACVVMVSIHGTRVYGSTYKQLTDSVHSTPLKQYLCNKFDWFNEQFHCVNWGAMESYMSSLTPCKETNVIKMVTNWQNDNNQNSLFYKDMDSICSACKLWYKDHMHFLSCPDPAL